MTEKKSQNKLSDSELINLKRDFDIMHRLIADQQEDIDGLCKVLKSIQAVINIEKDIIKINKKFSIIAIHVLPNLMMGLGVYLCITYKGEHPKIISMMFLIVCSIFALVTFLHYNRFPDRSIFHKRKG